jgi:hypothetical protein
MRQIFFGILTKDIKHDQLSNFCLMWKPLNVITLGRRETDYNNQIKILSE